jgi:hypothetical protein
MEWHLANAEGETLVNPGDLDDLCNQLRYEWTGSSPGDSKGRLVDRPDPIGWLPANVSVYCDDALVFGTDRAIAFLRQLLEVHSSGVTLGLNSYPFPVRR